LLSGVLNHITGTSSEAKKTNKGETVGYEFIISVDTAIASGAFNIPCYPNTNVTEETSNPLTSPLILDDNQKITFVCGATGSLWIEVVESDIIEDLLY